MESKVDEWTIAAGIGKEEVWGKLEQTIFVTNDDVVTIDFSMNFFVVYWRNVTWLLSSIK